MENTYTNITLAAPTTTTISGGPCILSAIIINKAASGGVITIYDGTSSGTVIGTITTPTADPTAPLNSPNRVEYEVCCKKGLTIVTSIAAQDITISHRPTA